MTAPPIPDGGAHRVDAGGAGISEPVLASHIASAIAWGLDVTGWAITPSSRTLDLIGVAAAFVITVVAATLARARVSPTGRITWLGVRAAIRAEVYAEVSSAIDRLAAAAPVAITAVVPAAAPVAPAVAPAVVGDDPLTAPFTTLGGG